MTGLSAMLEAYERGRLLAMMERDIAGVTGVRRELMGDQALEGRSQRLDRMSSAEVCAFLGRPQQAVLNQPAKPINCVNCGAPRQRASSLCCDYCGSR